MAKARKTVINKSGRDTVEHAKFKSEVKRYNERMAALQRRGLKSEALKLFEQASETQAFSNLFTTSKPGKQPKVKGRKQTTSQAGLLKLRTDFSKLTDAELDLMKKIMNTGYATGETTISDIKEKYKEIGVDPDYIDEYISEANEITESSTRRVYYNDDTHEQTSAYFLGLSKDKAIFELVKLKQEGHISPVTGDIYPARIDELNKKFAAELALKGE